MEMNNVWTLHEHTRQELAGMNMLCSDKMGTYTQNIMTIESKLPWYETVQQGLLLFFVSFNRVVQCTSDHTGHVFHARTDSVPLCLSRLQQSAHRVDALALAQGSRKNLPCHPHSALSRGFGMFLLLPVWT